MSLYRDETRGLGLFTAPDVKRVPTAGSQQHRILLHLREHGSMTQRDAFGLGCYRLAARIMELRDMGYQIETVDEKHEGGTHANYVLG